MPLSTPGERVARYAGRGEGLRTNQRIWELPSKAYSRGWRVPTPGEGVANHKLTN